MSGFRLDRRDDSNGPCGDLLTLGGAELARRIASRAVTSEAVVAAHLARMTSVDPAIHAMAAVAPDALDRARAADVALARGDVVRPLHGVPFTVKDWLETDDLICEGGFVERAGHRPRRDATSVARMRAAGAILMGKTAVRDGGPMRPRPENPHAIGRTPGESSSGEAAMIAAGGSPMGLASDSGGSIRWPAHCSGVAGLKPTTGLVAVTGHFPPIGHLSDPRTVVGPMARRAEDLALMLSVIAGEDGRDPGVVPAPLGDPGAVGVAGLRVGWFVAMAQAAPTAATVEAVGRAAQVLQDLGAKVREVAPPRQDEILPITKDHWRRVCSLSLSEWRPDRPAGLTSDEIERSTFAWERLARSLHAFMADLDILISPVAEGPAPLHGAWDERAFAYTLPWSLTRQPAASLPFATSPEGLPIGIQIIGRPWRDACPLAVAMALERFATLPPPPRPLGALRSGPGAPA
jgi:amidase